MPWRGRGATADREARRSPGRGCEPLGPALRVLGVAALAAASACAKEEPPPGAEPDQTPPRVRDFRPASGTVQPGFDDGFRVRFDEPIQENRALSRNMEASPALRYEVSFGFSEFEIRPRGGWRSAVYRFVFPPPIVDVLGNRSEDTLSVIFSTGPPVTDTRVAGRMRDRATGEQVRGGRAVFLAGGPDTVPYSAVAGIDGHFRLPAVPPGTYTAYGFEDLNANLSLERTLEPHDSTGFSLEGPSDSVFLDLLLVAPDTTAPVLLGARALDSLGVALTFDDPIRPGGGLRRAVATVRAIETGDTVPVAGIRLARDTAVVPADSFPTDDRRTLPEVPDAVPSVREILAEAYAIDTTIVPVGRPAAPRPDTGAARDVPPAVDATAEAGAGVGSDTLALPDTVAVVRLGRPLQAGTRYRVTARRFENLRRLGGGGDTTFVYDPADTGGPRTDPAAPPADTGGARADSAAARRKR